MGDDAPPSPLGKHFSHPSIGDLSDPTLQSIPGSLSIANVDVAQNHGVGCAPVRGRESHTADLAAFDRYVGIMEGERAKFLELEQLGLEVDHDERQEDAASVCSNGSCSSTASRTAPFNRKFWAHVRSILSNAKPVGFEELEDPRGVVPKGPGDANAFLEKAVSIGLVNPVSPQALAQDGGFSEAEVLVEMLYATRAGVARIQFAPECDRCGSVVTSRNRLADLPPTANCEGCNHPNVIDSLDRIKVLFLFNADILYILADNFACTPSKLAFEKTEIFATVPATSTGSGFRYSVGVGEGKELRPALSPGRYRMHCPVAKTDNFLVVKREATNDDEPYALQVRVSDIVCDEAVAFRTMSRRSSLEAIAAEHRYLATEHRSRLKTMTVPHGKVHFDVLPDTRSFFVLWVQEDADEDVLMRLPEDERSGYTKATTVVHNSVFNRLFAGQVVSSHPDSLLSIQNIVLVFTDVVGSTDLYASIGDGPALQLIRKHFRVLFGAFTKRGRVVKTVGDAVMASFTSGRAAMEAVADALRLLPRECRMPDGSPFQIRVGIHCGPAIVVPVNGVNDFFGQTVNIAARVEGAAKASECFVTEDVLSSDPDARDAYHEIISSNYVRRGSSVTGGSLEGSSASLGGLHSSGKKIFDATPKCDLTLKGVKGTVRARGFRLHSRPRRDSDAQEGALQSLRNMRRSGQFERLSISGISMDSFSSLGDSDEEDETRRDESRKSISSRRRSSSQRMLDDLLEEESDTASTDLQSSFDDVVETRHELKA